MLIFKTFAKKGVFKVIKSKSTSNPKKQSFYCMLQHTDVTQIIREIKLLNPVDINNQ